MAENSKPFVWQMVKEAVEALGGKTTNVAIRDWILSQYPGTNTNTIQCQIIVCTVNHPSRVHWPENKKARAANTEHDFLFRSSRGEVELYDPVKHGHWEIYEREDGRFAVRQVDSDIIDEAIEIPEASTEAAVSSGFAAEAHLRDYLAQHLEQVEPGLELYVDDDGTSGVEYATQIGRIDILAVDCDGGFVVIELKVSRGPDSVAGQALRYKNWVQKHLADGRRVRGVIIAQHVSERILYAIAADPAVSAKEYEMSLTLSDVAPLALQEEAE